MWWTIAAAAVSVASQIGKGKAQSDQYKGAAAANRYNAAVTRQKAETSYVTAGMREAQFRRQSAITQGKVRAAAAESGTGTGTGSNWDVERQNMLFEEMDALNVRYAGDLEARGFLDQAGMDEYNAELSDMSAKSAKRGGFLGAAGSLFTSAGKYLMPSGGGSVDE